MSRLSRTGDRDSFSVSDWWRAVSKPVPYRINGGSVHVSVYQIAKFSVMGLLALVACILIATAFGSFKRRNICLNDIKYNYTYPLSPVVEHSSGTTYKIALVSDLDTKSKNPDKKNTWISYIKKGTLFLGNNEATVNFDDNLILLESSISDNGRGMELSELIAFNGKLYSCDDRTGIVYEIKSNNKVVPWVILPDGDGNAAKVFKCEWATVKDERLWVGGLGKEWTTTEGVVQHLNPQWVKSIGVHGDVLHHDWIENYQSLRRYGGYDRPGYLIHESAMWSSTQGKWFFLPRRASKETYTEKDDERRATNLLFTADEDFSVIKMQRIGPLHLTRGFSSFKFVPGTDDNVIVALKSEEDGDKIATYIIIFKLNGDILLDETLIGEHKFEGIEFV